MAGEIVIIINIIFFLSTLSIYLQLSSKYNPKNEKNEKKRETKDGMKFPLFVAKSRENKTPNTGTPQESDTRRGALSRTWKEIHFVLSSGSSLCYDSFIIL